VGKTRTRLFHGTLLQSGYPFSGRFLFPMQYNDVLIPFHFEIALRIYIGGVIMDGGQEKKYQEKIKALESRIRDLEIAVNFTRDGLHLLDGEGYTILVNTSCEINEGLVWEKIKGKCITQLLEEGFLSESVTLKVLQENKTISLIQTVKNGKEMLVTGSPIHDADGKIFRVMVTSRDITDLNATKKQLLEAERRLQAEHEKLVELSLSHYSIPNIVHRSQAMRKVIEAALVVSKVDSNVLITGESGTGKGVISKFLHDNSARKDKPYVKIDCGSLPETLLESELFGYEKGAFTGAGSKGKIGLMELAKGGTLFLDEIAELSLNSQSKILSAIQDKQIYRVGGEDLIGIDVRIIAATNRDLGKMVEEKIFREDLYYRLNVVPIYIPPLRERKDDIQDLITNVMTALRGKYNFAKTISPDAMDMLIDYEWRGNVRELENLIERIIIMTHKAVVNVEDLPSCVKGNVARHRLNRNRGEALNNMVGEYEKYILAEMIQQGYSTAGMAEKFEVDVTTVRRKLKRHGLRRTERTGKNARRADLPLLM
jgi:PAS domain S-box-containing protein